jgi:hypothetical protein
MKFKQGDKVSIKEDIFDEVKHLVGGGNRFGFSIVRKDNDGCRIEDKKTNRGCWLFYHRLELADDNDPSTWRRNKPIMVRVVEEYFARHFYKVHEGKILCYANGRTSFTCERREDGTPKVLIAHHYREPTKEELG